MSDKPYRAWIISDGKVGRRNQCIGVAQKLSAEIEIIKLSDLLAAAKPREFLSEKFGNLTWPDLILSSGKEGGDAAIMLKKLSGGKVFIAAITSHISSMEFDLVADMQHARYRMSRCNVDMIGVPHKVTPEFIQNGVEEWRDRLESIMASGKPIISALIGGDVDERFIFDIETARKLGKELNAEVKRMGASLLITNSPRISVHVWRELLGHAMDGIANGYVHDCRAADGNPFPAMLGMANVIAVTGDSLSMCCEAAGTGKPTYIMAPRSIVPELYGLVHEDLYGLGLARKFEGSLDPYKITAPPLDEAGKIAKVLAGELAKFKNPPERGNLSLC